MVGPRADYTADAIEAARQVMLEVARVLGEYADSIVIVGGWVPELLLAATGAKHIGSNDVDIALNHRKLIRHQFVRSDVSGVPMLSEHAIWSPTSKRCCTPKEAALCNWRGCSFPKDELASCRLTGLTFSREFINDANEFRILRDLLDGKDAGADATDLVGWLSKNLNGNATGLKTARCTFSPDGSVRAVCGEARAMLGLKVRYTGLVTSERDTRQVLGRVVTGKRHHGAWTIEI